MGLESIVYPRPAEEFVDVKREPVEATCPSCGSSNVKRYPIVHYMGAKITVKCQDCFHRLSLEEPKPEDHWPPYRPVTADWEASIAG